MNTYNLKRMLKITWHRILDSSETLDHMESVVSVRIRRYKEANMEVD